MIDELLAGASTEEQIAGLGGLLAELTKRLVERAMEVELTDHVGHEPHAEPPGGAATHTSYQSVNWLSNRIVASTALAKALRIASAATGRQ